MKRHILIVDDEELFREICREMLEERGYEVSVAENASTALNCMSNTVVDLLVADITLPGMDGLTMIEQLRGKHPELPVIVITGYLTQENMLRSLNLGVRGFLTKPFFYDELFVSVEKALAQSEATRSQLLVHHYQPMISLGKEILATEHEEVFSKTLGTALRIGLQQTSATQGFVAVAEGDDGTFRLASSLGFTPEEQPHLESYLKAIQAALPPQQADFEATDLIPGMHALAVGMPGEGAHPGLLVLARPKSDDPFHEEESKLAHLLAVQTAIAIHHHASWRHAVEERDTAHHILADLSAALLPPDATHPNGEHYVALGGLANRVAKALHCPDGVAAAVQNAAIYHNLGKAFLPLDIVGKKGALTKAEWETMRTYPAAGAERLKRVPALADSAQLVAAQREHWDGSGYPDGLSGEAVPLGARIVGVVSAWGALTSARPHREALAHEEALRTLNGQAGKVYDGAVVKALVEVLEGAG
ncbi:MAG: HD domain-containing phosphohydrolase [Leptospirillia bacterium]